MPNYSSIGRSSPEHLSCNSEKSPASNTKKNTNRTRLTPFKRVSPEKPHWWPCPRLPLPEPVFACFAWMTSARTRACALATLTPAPSRPSLARPCNPPACTKTRQGTYVHLKRANRLSLTVVRDSTDEARAKTKVENVVVYEHGWQTGAVAHPCQHVAARYREAGLRTCLNSPYSITPLLSASTLSNNSFACSSVSLPSAITSVASYRQFREVRK